MTMTFFLAEIGKKCRDKNANCKTWQKRRWCKPTPSNSNIREMCRESCNLCDETGLTCEDKKPSYCAKTPLKYCVGNYMTMNCKKTCNYCGGGSCKDKNSSCETWAGMGFCTKHEAYMTISCKKSCGLC